ncbi:MAG TPA: hypothetical protein VEL51_06945 [Vicinamibacterales bacterium]|nr:hypothetical protein [Vicinamibacterales bacterium]
MKSSRAVLTAVVIIIVIAAGWWLFRRGGVEHIDLLAQFDQAQKSSGSFAVEDATLAGETKKAIAAPANGRITFHVRVPDDGWLKVSLGLKPEAWTKEGNGVYFFAGVSDGRAFEKLFDQTLNPFANPSERRWIPVTVDLSAYAGEEMDVILNTREGGPGAPADSRNDLPLWGAPEIVKR